MQRFLDQISLSRRWSLSPRTLERWRWLNMGPSFLKLGGRVLYRIEDIEEFETACLRNAGGKAVGGSRNVDPHRQTRGTS